MGEPARRFAAEWGIDRLPVQFVIDRTGVVDLILGVFIWNRWPESSLWVIGLFVGIDLLVHGWSNVILALALRTSPAPRSD